MAEADLAALIPDPMPQWLQRAMDPSTSATDQNETVRTMSSYSEDHGGELLYPTIRRGPDGLYKSNLQEALDAGDFILIPGPPGAETQARATDLSRFISNTLITNARAGQVDQPLYYEDPPSVKLSLDPSPPPPEKDPHSFLDTVGSVMKDWTGEPPPEREQGYRGGGQRMRVLSGPQRRYGLQK
jgi:hypothetical protein